MSLEKHFPPSTNGEMNHHHEKIETADQEQARSLLQRLVAENRGPELRELMTRFLGADGVTQAFSSNEALQAILSQHGLEVELNAAGALRKG